MSSWERLVDLVCQTERALFDLKAECATPKWKALWDEEAGWYTRGYLVHRLPAEMARSQATGRPFGIALLRLGEDDRLEAPRWRAFLRSQLEPMELAVAYAERELCFLFPERAEASTLSRFGELVNASSLAGLFSFASACAACVSYPASGAPASPAALLEQLERGLEPLATINRRADVAASGGAKANGVHDLREPAAVGFAADRTMPVSFWFQGELYAIDAVLDDDGQGQRLTVLARSDRFRLEQAGPHWYAQKLG